MEPGVGSDAALVARAQAGEAEAFDRLVMRHRGRVLRIAQEIGRDPEAAQDLAQQALFNAFRALPSLREGARFGPWVNTIVRRLGQEWMREGGRRPEPVAEVQQGVPGVFGTAPPEPPGDVAARVRQALSRLSQRERRVLIRHYLHGLTCEEIAAETGLAPGSIKRLLYNTRRKARKECDQMAEAEQGTRGPQRLRVWIDGNAGPGPRRIFERLRPVLMQSICLAANKRARTAPQLAQEVGAHEEYVREAVAELMALEVLVSPRPDRYVANFIAFSAEDWRRLMRLVPQPAAEIAAQFAGSQGRLRAAYERTPLATAGWEWERAAWAVNAVLLANVAVGRWQNRVTPLPLPERPDGGRYWLGGHEEAPGLPDLWTNGLNSHVSTARLRVSNFWTWQMRPSFPSLRSAPKDQGALVEALTAGPGTEAELVAHAEGREEEMQSALADLVQLRWAARENGRYRLNLPLFAQAESDVLTPEIDAAVDPVMREVIQPALQEVNARLEEMGYGHRREQYEEWHVWLSRHMTGESLRYLMEQGVLPRPDDPAAPDFAHLVWWQGIELMDFGRDYG